MQQMEGDPLKENLDQLLPLTDSGVRVVPASLPSAVEDICSALMEEEGIDAVDIGRQACRAMHRPDKAYLFHPPASSSHDEGISV